MGKGTVVPGIRWSRSGGAICLLAWACTAMLMITAVLVYLTDPVTNHFETWPVLTTLLASIKPFLPILDVPAGIRFWLADFAWACLAALFAAELCQVWRKPAGSRGRNPVVFLIILLAACSWELLQWLRLVGGVFDVIDLMVSLLAGVLVVLAAHLSPAGAWRENLHEKA